MPSPVKHNISRTLWRFLEISLFFLVSVLGYSFLAKTTTCNAKSKSKENSSRIVAVQCFFEDDIATLYFSQETPVSASSHFRSALPFYALFHHPPGRITSNVQTTPALTYNAHRVPKTSLFLQNQVLII